MTDLQPADAATALAQVKGAQRRSAELRGYAHAGKHLIAWGLVWLVGNLAAQFAPTAAKWVWMAAITFAVAFQLLSAGRRSRSSSRVLATVAAVLGFCVATIALVGVEPALQPAFMSLAVAGAYVGLGIWTGVRFAWVGLVLAAIILVARFTAPSLLPLALGLGGGGALILSGLWLRRA